MGESFDSLSYAKMFAYTLPFSRRFRAPVGAYLNP